MPIDQRFAQALRATLAPRGEVEEKIMFGLLVFMLDGKACMGVGDEELLFRIDPALHDEALERTGAREMRHGQRVMRGFIFVETASLLTRAQLDHWVSLALDFNPRAKAAAKRPPARKAKAPPAPAP